MEMVKPLFELPIGEEDEEWTPEASEQPDVGMEPGSAPRPKVLPPPDARKRSQCLRRAASLDARRQAAASVPRGGREDAAVSGV